MSFNLVERYEGPFAPTYDPIANPYPTYDEAKEQMYELAHQLLEAYDIPESLYEGKHTGFQMARVYIVEVEANRIYVDLGPEGAATYTIEEV